MLTHVSDAFLKADGLAGVSSRPIDVYHGYPDGHSGLVSLGQSGLDRLASHASWGETSEQGGMGGQQREDYEGGTPGGDGLIGVDETSQLAADPLNEDVDDIDAASDSFPPRNGQEKPGENLDNDANRLLRTNKVRHAGMQTDTGRDTQRHKSQLQRAASNVAVLSEELGLDIPVAGSIRAAERTGNERVATLAHNVLGIKPPMFYLFQLLTARFNIILNAPIREIHMRKSYGKKSTIIGFDYALYELVYIYIIFTFMLFNHIIGLYCHW